MTNPALNQNAFRNVHSHGTDVMTLQGTVNKTYIMLFLVILTAGYIWHGIYYGVELILPFNILMYTGIFGGIILALATIFKKEWSPVTAPLYAAFEGLAIGGISAVFELMYPGIVIQAVSLTFGTLFVLLTLYKSGTIRVTDKFRTGIIAATGAVALIYIVNFVMSFFSSGVPFIYSSSLFGIGFSLVVVAIAAMNLLLDFDFITKSAVSNAPKYMEWYASFGLMITLIWLYFEILRLLSKLQDRK